MYQLIRASAGTGKTFRLSGQYLRQLFLGHSPDSILATTFTRKAAGEIQGRVLTRLAAAAASDDGARLLAGFLDLPQLTSEGSEQLLGKLTRNLHRMRICTLDSFFQQAARGLTLELGLPPGWSIVEEHLDRELREQAIDAVLSQQLPQDAQQLMQMLAHGRSRRSIRDLIDQTVSGYHELFLQTPDTAWNQVPTPTRLTAVQRDEALHQLAAAELPSHKKIAAARQQDIDRFRNERWDEFVGNGIAAKVLDGSERYYNKELDEAVCSIYRRLLSHATAEILNRLSRQMQAIYDLISRFDREYSILKADHGWLGFGDVTRMLSGAGSGIDGEQMNYRLDSSIRNLLLDEFQDTSSDQWNILKRLTTTILDGGADSSFLCVGDGKQAIYGWRGGVAEILDAVPPAIPGIIESPLNESRRSSQAVITTVNRLFTGIGEHPNLDHYREPCLHWQERFPEHSTAVGEMPGFAVLRTSPELEAESADERKGQWNRWVALQIQGLHQQTPGAEIGVLTRRNETVARLVHELNQLGVPASEEGGTPPTDSAAVLAVLSLLHFAAHPSCTVSRYHAANSPLGPLFDLTDWEDEFQAAQVAEDIRSRWVDDGYGATLQWIADRTADQCSTRDRLRLAQIAAEGLAFDEVGSLNPADFVRLLEESRFQKSERAPVRVMTVHQSKGLEFDRVVLPELEVPLFRAPQAAYTGPDAGSPPDRVCVWTNRTIWTMLPHSLQQAFLDTESRSVAESLCLLYVAVTRARHDLTMLVPPTNPGKPPKNYAGLLVSALAETPADQPLATLFQTGDEFWFRTIPAFLKPRLRQVAAVSSGKPIRLLEMPGGRLRGLERFAPSEHTESSLALIIGKEPTAADSKFGEDSVAPADRGTLFHHWFEQIDWLDTESAITRERLLSDLPVLNYSKQNIDLLLQQFLDALQKPAVQELLSQRFHVENPPVELLGPSTEKTLTQITVQQERTFLFRDEKRIVQGSIDRLVLYQSGQTVVAADILDWKTDSPWQPATEWIESRRRYYHQQLETYRRAVMQAYRLPATAVRARLVLVATDEVCTTRPAV